MSIFCNFENLSNSEKFSLLKEIKEDEAGPEYLQIGFTSEHGFFYIKYYVYSRCFDFDSCIMNIEELKDISDKQLPIQVLEAYISSNNIEMCEDSDIKDVEEFKYMLEHSNV